VDTAKEKADRSSLRSLGMTAKDKGRSESAGETPALRKKQILHFVQDDT